MPVDKFHISLSLRCQCEAAPARMSSLPSRLWQGPYLLFSRLLAEPFPRLDLPRPLAVSVRFQRPEASSPVLSFRGPHSPLSLPEAVRGSSIPDRGEESVKGKRDGPFLQDNLRWTPVCEPCEPSGAVSRTQQATVMLGSIHFPALLVHAVRHGF
jgi:hypothetical protein